MRILIGCLLLTALVALPALSLAQAPAPFFTGFVEGEALKEGELNGLAWSTDGLQLADGQAEGTYTSPELAVQPFEYAILSWNADTPAGASLEVQARFLHREKGEWTPWLSWGMWEKSPKRASRSSSHELAAISYDTAWVAGDNVRAEKLQLRAILRGEGAVLRRIAYTLHDTGVAERPADPAHQGALTQEQLAYSQGIRESTIASVMCSAVTTCTQLNLAGEAYLPEEIALMQYDAALNGYGNWSFNMAMAGELGYKAYVTYADEEELLRLLDQGRAVGMSVRYSGKPDGGQPYLEGAPMTTDGHLITVRGYEIADGQRWYLVSDSAAATDEQAHMRYRGSQLMDAWVSRILYVVEGKEAESRAIVRLPATLSITDKTGVYQLGDVPAKAVFLGFTGAARNKPGGGYLAYTVDGQPGTRFDAKAAGDNLVKFPDDVPADKVTLYVMTNLGITYVAQMPE
ncbi:MAG: hypothetical protein GX653_00145 [Clostridiales bacterium]|nr:hypothetical protein [Clostridiales bacterium]